MTSNNTEPNAAPTSAAFFVPGIPAPQGSKRAYANRRTGRVQLVEMSKRVKPWRAAVKAAAEAEGVRIRGAVYVYLGFFLPRPRSHYRTGRNAHLLRDHAPRWPTSHAVGDLDKLTRSTLDGLTAGGVLDDDADVVKMFVEKAYAPEGTDPGADVVAVRLTPGDTEAVTGEADRPPNCPTCGRPCRALTNPTEQCAACFDAAWDAQIDAAADRFERFAPYGRPSPTPTDPKEAA
ncbi:MAG: RusA family crossover junction endodeoxyribonuclease [Propionibacteriaceae bacterium]|nr:RusA family crossover junction endodeoxyribonuclease [Propionibacteriaceae bacterium]